MKNRFEKVTLVLCAGLLLNFGLGLTGCSDPSQPNVELIQDMMENPAVKAQEYDESAPHKMGGARTPPKNTIPIGFTPYEYAGEPVAAEANLKNPLAGDESLEGKLLGQKHYETQCMVCHGVKGAGDGPVASKMALKPPPLISDKVKAMKDGRIYHILHDGQGLMNPYSTHIRDEKARWAVVNYIRHLQMKAEGKN